jgi:hypothetical protein
VWWVGGVWEHGGRRCGGCVVVRAVVLAQCVVLVLAPVLEAKLQLVEGSGRSSSSALAFPGARAHAHAAMARAAGPAPAPIQGAGCRGTHRCAWPLP